jgi:anaerobic magnesium-protoporphyrin IX monomethyl ester cyclase
MTVAGIWDNPKRGKQARPRLAPAQYPSVEELEGYIAAPRSSEAMDVLLVNPPAPDGAVWIRSQHRVGRRSRENMIWPQVDLAQLAALLMPDYRVAVIDAIAERMSWKQFEERLRTLQPRFYVTQVTAPTLQNDMYGCFLARALGARTIAFGTHVTPMARQTLQPYPALDFVLRGEPELTLCELLPALDGRAPSSRIIQLLRMADPDWRPPVGNDAAKLAGIKGLAWRRGDEIVINPDRPFIPDLDALPLPAHALLPLNRYRIPMLKGPYTFVVTSRGCPAGCRFCIKHVNYQQTVRLRSPENIMQELLMLQQLGIRNIHMYADLFTVNREQVMGLCALIRREGLRIRWTCNSRVDFVDAELLRHMAQAGCWLISWGIESGDAEILRRVRKGYHLEQAEQALRWAKAVGIKNWGYFIIGLPGETEESIRRTIEFAKRLPLDLALFHIAAPHPGTPFFFEVVERGWFRPGTRWEEVDMDGSTVLDYPGLPAERLEYWQRRAFREWSLRPGPLWTYLKMLANPGTWRSALEVGWRHLGWV